MKRVTQDDIIQMNEAYLSCGSYSAVAKSTGWSASTVRKYIIPNYKSNINQNIEVDNIKLPPINEIVEWLPPWYDITCLTPEEEKEIKILWKEMQI